ncbi:YkgJ family cysteine cluster protein [Candidatus Woesearchaeota archaeon]|nr:YkgJ family cysteine cluster protein [Candidatus Woesearchaeota archaeon]
MISVDHIKCKSCRKAGHCVRTGECCHIRESLTMDAKEDRVIRDQVYHATGVIYLYPMSRYTISLTQKERDWMVAEAKKRKLAFKVLPKRVLLDGKKAVVYDWFVDHDVCPFLQNGNECTIYPNRPKICADFPFHHLKKDQVSGIKTFISSRHLALAQVSFTEAVRKARESLTEQGIGV